MKTHNQQCVARRLVLLQACAVNLHIYKEAFVDNLKKARRSKEENGRLENLFLEMADNYSALITSCEKKMAELTAEIMELCHD